MSKKEPYKNSQPLPAIDSEKEVIIRLSGGIILNKQDIDALADALYPKLTGLKVWGH
jgi:selenocysteine lyase/cysteine desulfurase